MTPERKAEIDAQITWWRQQEHWRKNGFNIVTKDPLFAPRRSVPDTNTKQRRILHCRFTEGWAYTYMEHEVDFEFTGRIKYRRDYGEFIGIVYELTWDYYERTWRTLWLKKVRKFTTYWAAEDRFEDLYPHTKSVEFISEDCNDPQPV